MLKVLREWRQVLSIKHINRQSTNGNVQEQIDEWQKHVESCHFYIFRQTNFMFQNIAHNVMKHLNNQTTDDTGVEVTHEDEWLKYDELWMDFFTVEVNNSGKGDMMM